MSGDGSANLAKVAVGRRQVAEKHGPFLPPAPCYLPPHDRHPHCERPPYGYHRTAEADACDWRAGRWRGLAAQMWRRRDPYEFAGRSVVITGGSRGLGLVIARQLADEGAR